MELFFTMLVPLIIAAVALYGMARRVDVYAAIFLRNKDICQFADLCNRIIQTSVRRHQPGDIGHKIHLAKIGGNNCHIFF